MCLGNEKAVLTACHLLMMASGYAPEVLETMAAVFQEKACHDPPCAAISQSANVQNTRMVSGDSLLPFMSAGRSGMTGG